MKLGLKLLAAGTLALLLAAPAAAAIDAEIELRYWGNDTTVEITGEPNEEGGMPGAGLRAEIAFFKRLAIAGEYYKLSGEDNLDGTDFTRAQLDVKWRIIAPTENTFFALGLGYEGFEVEGEDVSTDTTGVRVVADGRFGFVGILYVYGRLAYITNLGEIEIEGVSIEGDNGLDLDIGLGIEPLPILSLWVGYRSENFDFNLPSGLGSLSIDNTGPYIGVGVHF